MELDNDTLLKYIKIIVAIIVGLITIIKGAHSFYHWLRDKINKEEEFQLTNSKWQLFGMLTPKSFYGRNEQIAKIRRLVISERVKCVILHAVPGCGKSTLASIFLLGTEGDSKINTDLMNAYSKGVLEHFKHVLWWRLTDAPLLKELIKTIYKIINKKNNKSIAENTVVACQQLLDDLGKNKILIVLDNFETLLDDNGDWRSGFENYEIFLRSVCESKFDRVSLLITTREFPKIINELNYHSRSSQIIQLEGLDSDSFKNAILCESQLKSATDTWKWISERYRGNPLAARILSTYIAEMYDSNIDNFRRNEPDMVPEFSELLEYHFNRLTPYEKEIAYWLAVNREPVEIEVLKSDLLTFESKTKVTSSLKKLCTRIPIESSQKYYTLQPVLLDFISLRICNKMGNMYACGSNEINNYLSRLLKDDISKEFKNGEFGLFDRICLVKGSSPEHIRMAQKRTLIFPLLESFNAHSGSKEITLMFLREIVDRYRHLSNGRRSYIGTNIATLIMSSEGKLENEDFSHTTLIQPYFSDTRIINCNFEHAVFVKPRFIEKQGAILELDISPCNKYVAIAGTLGEIRVWNFDTRMLIYSAILHKNWVRTVKFLAEKIVSAGNDGEIVVTDFLNQSNKEVRINAHIDWINSIIIIGNDTFASLGEDGFVRIWSESLILLGEINVNRKIFDGYYSEVKQELVICTEGGFLYFVALKNFKVSSYFEISSRDLQKITFSEVHNAVICGDDMGEISLFELSSLTVINKFNSESIFTRSLLVKGHLIYVGSEDGLIKVYDPDNKNTLVQQYKTHEAAVRSIVLLSNEKQIITASEDKSVKVTDLLSASIVDNIIGFSNTIWSANITSNGHLVAGLENGELVVWKRPFRDHRRTIQTHTGRIFTVSVNSVNELVASAGVDKVVKVTDLNTDSLIATFEGHTDWIIRVCFSHCGNFVFSASEDKTVMCWDIRNLTRKWVSRAHQARVTSIEVVKGCEFIFTGDENGVIAKHNAESGQLVTYYSGNKSKVRAMVLEINSQLLAVATEDGMIKIWNKNNSLMEQEVRISKSQIWGLVLTHSKSKLIAANNEGTLIIVNFNTLEVIKEVKAHNQAIWDLQMDRQRDYVYSSSGDETISIWDSEALIETERLKAPLPYEGTSFCKATGLTIAQKSNLEHLGASI